MVGTQTVSRPSAVRSSDYKGLCVCVGGGVREQPASFITGVHRVKSKAVRGCSGGLGEGGRR